MRPVLARLVSQQAAQRSGHSLLARMRAGQLDSFGVRLSRRSRREVAERRDHLAGRQHDMQVVACDGGLGEGGRITRHECQGVGRGQREPRLADRRRVPGSVGGVSQIGSVSQIGAVSRIGSVSKIGAVSRIGQPVPFAQQAQRGHCERGQVTGADGAIDPGRRSQPAVHAVSEYRQHAVVDAGTASRDLVSADGKQGQAQFGRKERTGVTRVAAQQAKAMRASIRSIDPQRTVRTDPAASAIDIAARGGVPGDPRGETGPLTPADADFDLGRAPADGGHIGAGQGRSVQHDHRPARYKSSALRSGLLRPGLPPRLVARPWPARRRPGLPRAVPGRR